MVKRSLLAGALAVLLLAGCAPEPTEVEQPSTAATVPQSQPTEPSTTAATEVPQPSTEVTEPVTEPEDGDFVRILDYIPQARQHLPYATDENFTGQVIYQFTDAYLRYGTVKKLMAVSLALEEQGLGLLIWDGYRPVYAQARLYQVCPDPTYVSPPGVGNQNHCRGRAVDLTLVDLATGGPLVMPTGFDDFSDLADRDYSDVSSEAAQNARLLEDVMQRYGFQGYRGEWWHFNDTQEYPIEEEFDPAQVG